ncbi:DUF2975 domain-containing protein [Zunongwangia endophytica]|uniref:DUF2975 domain-containing protein n=1 Tax=Zunongwangia endophytica TaxID=1808945 RepID=A0ABV8H411_9FLAO|nr:DUF2975 domain-containing protein [Zunongwangia endophytica]MDN3595651.1 DUF2975 domain-containing protein [Zunongwangia endophytica]
MKWHLNILKIIVITVIALLIASALINILGAIHQFDMLNEISNSFFFKNYFPERSFDYSKNGERLFYVLNSAVFIYLAIGLRKVPKLINDILKENLFYPYQAEEIRRISSTIIGYAKLKFLIILCCGAFFLMSPFNILGFIPSFIILYILGKVLLLLGKVVAKGEVIKQENDLTV